MPASPRGGQRAPAALQVERERERVGGHLDRPVRQHRPHHPLAVGADGGADDQHVGGDRAGQHQPRRLRDQTLGACRSAGSARGELGDQQQPEHAQQLPAVAGEDPHRGVRGGGGRRGTCSEASRGPGSRAPRGSRARPAARRRSAAAAISAASATVATPRGRLRPRRSGARDAGWPRGAAAGASDKALTCASTPAIACSDTCASSSARSSWPAARSGRLGNRTSVARRCSASRLSSRIAALGARSSWRATISSRPGRHGLTASSTRRGAAHAAGGRGQHPRHVRRLRERHLVGLPGQRAAVDHGQRVPLAGVFEQQLDAVARALRA